MPQMRRRGDLYKRLADKVRRSFIHEDRKSGWARFFVDTDICTFCGFFEEYIQDDDLRDVKKMSKMKAGWRKI